MSAKRILSSLLLVAVVIGTVLTVRMLNDPQRAYRSSGKYGIFEIEGQLVPPFDAKVVGKDQTLTRDDLDRATLFVFFGTFCPHCKEEMPAVQQVAKEFDGRANVYAVDSREFGNMATDEREKRVAEFMAENHWADVPTLLAPTQMQSAFRIEAVPSLVLIDRNRTIHYVGLGEHSVERLQSLLQEVL